MKTAGVYLLSLSLPIHLMRTYSTTTEHVESVVSVGSLATSDGLAAFLSLPALLGNLSVIGLGVTEAGIQSGSTAIRQLEAFLHAVWSTYPTRLLSVINTDNIDANGDKIYSYVKEAAAATENTTSRPKEFMEWLDSHVVFHNTMVDRVVSQRDGNAHVPRCEPLPSKALVIEDVKNFLSHVKWRSSRGVVIRSKEGEIVIDHALKLRVINAIHTALVYTMALSKIKDTRAASHPLLVSGFMYCI